jgi:hypothetical protein
MSANLSARRSQNAILSSKSEPPKEIKSAPLAALITTGGNIAVLVIIAVLVVWEIKTLTEVLILSHGERGVRKDVSRREPEHYVRDFTLFGDRYSVPLSSGLNM